MTKDYDPNARYLARRLLAGWQSRSPEPASSQERGPVEQACSQSLEQDEGSDIGFIRDVILTRRYI